MLVMSDAHGGEQRRSRSMSVVGHLEELRRRLFRIGLALVLGTVTGWVTSDMVWATIRSPVVALVEDAGRDVSINYSTITSAFDVKFQVALMVGVVVSSPVWLYQVFAFLTPGFTRREAKYVMGFMGTALPLFVGGCLAGWLVTPHVVELMTRFVPTEDVAFLGAKEYLDFALKLIIATGVAFVVPDFLVLLNFSGVLSAQTILKSWRGAMVVIATFAALATPAADVLAMIALAVPMIFLFFSAAGVAALHDRRVRRKLLAAT
jgi:sec-independent protein translocase protein TatC